MGIGKRMSNERCGEEKEIRRGRKSENKDRGKEKEKKEKDV